MFDRELQCTCLWKPQSVTTREVMEGANSQHSVKYSHEKEKNECENNENIQDLRKKL